MLSTDSRASKASGRMAGVTGALLLQVLFLIAFLHSLPNFTPPALLGRELTLILPRLLERAAPALPMQNAAKISVPAVPQAPLALVPSVPAAPPASVPGIAAFGQSLFGCAPERYASLPPDQQARCPRPGDGVAIQQEPSLLGIRPEAKDEALWQEQWAEDHWMPALCDPSEEAVVECMMHQSIAESERAADVQWHLARDKAAALKPPEPPTPPKAKAR